MSAPDSSSKAIATPPIDAACGGGVSLAIALLVILFGWFLRPGVDKVLVAVETYLLLDMLINSPHFMASYRLLYSNPSHFRSHPIVTILMPIVFVGFLGYVSYQCFSYPESTGTYRLGVITILNWIAPILLGWHYMGQTWGMTACFAFLGGLRMNPTERRMIRCGLHVLFVYHVLWAFDSMGFVQSILVEEEAGKYLMEFLLKGCRLALFIAFVIGLLGFRKLSERESKPIPVRMWLPWVATYSWYIMLDVTPASFFLLQIFHALQYLTFPARVELNVYSNPKHPGRHLLVYYILLVVAGLVVFRWSNLLGGLPDSKLQIATATMMIVNIHHYFIDAVIWKIRNPEVRENLFGHLQAESK